MLGKYAAVGSHLVPAGTTVLTAEVLTAAAAVHGGFVVTKRCVIRRLKFIVSTVILAGDAAPVVEFNRRPTLGSASGEVLLGQLTIPSGTAVGMVVYKDITPVVLEVGDELSCEHVTAAADPGTETGGGYYAFECDDSPEYKSNESNLLASV